MSYNSGLDVRPTTNPKERGDPDFGTRFRQACADNPKLPEKNYGLFTFLRRHMEAKGHKPTLESVRKWYLGHTVPRHEKLVALAEVLEVDPHWLLYGIGDRDIEPQPESPLSNPRVAGAVNIVAGALQLAGFSTGFMEPGDPNAQRGHLYVTIGGLTKIVYVSQGEDAMDGGNLIFQVPADHSRTLCIAVVATSHVEFDFIRLHDAAIDGSPVVTDQRKEVELRPSRLGYTSGKGGVIRPVTTLNELFT